ncbi:NAD(P)H-binding protein [uncultured Trichococcus sp.]|uniref:NAD(P)H-binding protein n=1 Tax=uncultured Trichococcus sp. TaxID=189665 RepID=UPI0029C6A436|nr:NAD(P)H-binding protein [uncultured Trichococcus sp.]
MTKIVIIGATGSVGRVARKLFLEKTNDELTLFSRRPEKLKPIDSTREIAVSGDVMNASDLDKVISGQDVVFASLTGNLGKMAKAIVESMKRVGVNRLIFIASMGIYNEIPASIGSSGNLRSNPVLQTYRDAADVIEASGLDYTIIRPGWFDSSNDTDYEISVKGEPFGGHDVSRKSIADLVVRLAADPTLYVRESVGINRPE